MRKIFYIKKAEVHEKNILWKSLKIVPIGICTVVITAHFNCWKCLWISSKFLPWNVCSGWYEIISTSTSFFLFRKGKKSTGANSWGWGLISVSTFCGINFKTNDSMCAGALSCNKNQFDQSNSLQKSFHHLLINWEFMVLHSRTNLLWIVKIYCNFYFRILEVKFFRVVMALMIGLSWCSNIGKLLRYDPAYSCRTLPMFPRNLLSPSSGYEMNAASSSETWVTYQARWCRTP